MQSQVGCGQSKLVKGLGWVKLESRVASGRIMMQTLRRIHPFFSADAKPSRKSPLLLVRQ